NEFELLSFNIKDKVFGNFLYAPVAGSTINSDDKHTVIVLMKGKISFLCIDTNKASIGQSGNQVIYSINHGYKVLMVNCLPTCNIIAFAIKINSKAIDFYRKCRSEEHTSELQSRENLVCRRVLEQK